MICLRGTTWAHTRGYAPLATAARAYSDMHSEVELVWEQRSLWAFGEAPLGELARDYDLVVFDHPWTGFAAANELFLPLDEHLDPHFLQTQQAGSVGPSYRSYSAAGQQWALPLDAAAQVSAARPDLLAAAGRAVPRTWDEVLALARDTGTVAIPLTPMGAWATFLTLCANQGRPAMHSADCLVESELGEHVLAQIKELFALVDAGCLSQSPIAVLNRMARGDEIAYVPLLYGYSNYARDGYAPRRIAFHAIPAAGDSGPRGANLGGAGLAVSANTRHLNAALDFLAWVCDAEHQRTLYTLSGGQPGHRAAWEDPLANLVTHDFFRDTLPTLDAAYLRPTWNGFAAVQTTAGQQLHAFLRGEADAGETLARLDDAYTRAAAGAAFVPHAP